MNELVWSTYAETLKYSDKRLFQWHFVHHKSNMVLPLIETGFLQRQEACNLSSTSPLLRSHNF